MNTLVDEYLAANPVQKNILFTDTASLAEAIEKRQPTLSNLTIQRTFLLKLRLTVRETTPLLIWQSGNDLWLLGEDGRILAPAKAGERGLGLIVDTAQITVKPGDKVSDAVFVSFTRTIISEMKRRTIELETAYIESTTRELKLRLKSGVVVRTDTSRGPGEQLDAYQATVQTSQRTKEPITEYVDVRIPGKTFYK
ncbi:cell division protein FtsQ/DivIB [Candidatus Saccharibacteria bacterium]|nr:cell division protein FtsQ/DivIB [Candidatus Saccharibacteria bacterium]